GVAEPGRIKALLGKTARLSFHLMAAEGEAALSLPGSEPGQRYLLARTPLLEGGHLKDAHLGFDPNTRDPVVNFRLDDEGGERCAAATRASVGGPFPIVLDGEVIAAAVMRSVISGGSGQMSGGCTPQSAGDRALLLRAGAVPAPLDVVEERSVGPE